MCTSLPQQFPLLPVPMTTGQLPRVSPQGWYGHPQGVLQRPAVMTSPLGPQSGSALHLHRPPAQPHRLPASAAQYFAYRPSPAGGHMPAQPYSRPTHIHMTQPVSVQQASANVVTSGGPRHVLQQAPASVFPRPLPTAGVSAAQTGRPPLDARQIMGLQLQTAMLEALRQRAAERPAQPYQAPSQHPAAQQAAQQQQMAAAAVGKASMPGMQPPSHTLSFAQQQQQQQDASALQRQATVPGSPAQAVGYPAQQAAEPVGPQQPPAAASQPQAPQLGAPMHQQVAVATGQPQRKVILPSTGGVVAPGNAQAAAQLPYDNQVFMQVALAQSPGTLAAGHQGWSVSQQGRMRHSFRACSCVQAVADNIASSQDEVQDTIRKLKAGKEVGHRTVPGRVQLCWLRALCKTNLERGNLPVRVATAGHGHSDERGCPPAAHV